MVSNISSNTILATLGFTLLSLGVASSIVMSSPNNSFAQEDQQQRGLLGGLEREQSDEAIPGRQSQQT